MKSTFQNNPASRRSDHKIGRVVFGVFLGLGMLGGVGIGNLGARQATKKSLDHAVESGRESAREMEGALRERTRTLELLASLPLRELKSAGGPLDRFKTLYSEFRSLRIEKGAPQPAGSAILLSAKLPDGQLLVGSLRRGWASKLLQEHGVAKDSVLPETSVLLDARGPLAGVVFAPASGRDLRNANSLRPKLVRWSDGEEYFTLLERLDTAGIGRDQLSLATGVWKADVAAQEAKMRRAGLILGLILGLFPGALAWFGVARSTRRLRATNRTLEERMSLRTKELASAERSFREIFENVPLGLYQCDAMGRFVRVNPAMAQTFGFEHPEEAAEHLGSLDAIGHPTERMEFIAKLKTAGRAETMVALQGVHGRCTWLRETAHAVYGPDGRLQGFEGVVTDVTEQLALEAQLRQIGATDPLTGLLNRRGFQEAIGNAEFPATVAVLDVDRFKEFNDTYGHPAGDRALRTVAEAMQNVVRERGLLARTGGEEFAVFLPGTGLEAGLEIAQELRAAVEACSLRENMLTVSGGVARASELTDVSQAFEAADRALYAAKEGGRNRVVAAATSLR
jgi:diguanylate cyclase (GGDEF)-like protein/PAS domain S-box-containing protein